MSERSGLTTDQWPQRCQVGHWSGWSYREKGRLGWKNLHAWNSEPVLERRYGKKNIFLLLHLLVNFSSHFREGQLWSQEQVSKQIMAQTICFSIHQRQTNALNCPICQRFKGLTNFLAKQQCDEVRAAGPGHLSKNHRNSGLFGSSPPCCEASGTDLPWSPSLGVPQAVFLEGQKRWHCFWILSLGRSSMNWYCLGAI